MSRLAIAVIAALGALALALPLAGCGAEQHTEVVEGQPLELGELRYNVAITRFLNPDDVEDSGYLAGQEPAPPGKSWLGVFLTISNDDDENAHPSAADYVVRDTRESEYLPVESESPYALEIGAEVAAGSQLPIPDSTAASGVIQAAMLLFLVDDEVSESRPLKLEIDSADGSGEVELDI